MNPRSHALESCFTRNPEAIVSSPFWDSKKPKQANIYIERDRYRYRERDRYRYREREIDIDIDINIGIIYRYRYNIDININIDIDIDINRYIYISHSNDKSINYASLLYVNFNQTCPKIIENPLPNAAGLPGTDAAQGSSPAD